jgi:Tol biopolymer transport system component
MRSALIAPIVDPYEFALMINARVTRSTRMGRRLCGSRTSPSGGIIMKQAFLLAAVLAAATATAASATTHTVARNGRIAFAQQYEGDAYGGVYAVNANGSGRVLLTQGSNPVWSPDGTRVLFENRGSGDPDLWTVNADGGHPKELTFSVGVDQDGSWSPAGTRIAFESNRENLSGSDVFVMNADGTGATRLTPAAGFDGDPAFSPDGTKIAFTSDRGGTKDIWVMNADGSAPRRLTTAARTDENPAWSPDGTKIAFDTDRTEPGNLDVWVMNADGSDQHPLITSEALDALPAYSPDGTQIAFVSERSGRNRRAVYRANADGTNVRFVAAGTYGGLEATQPSWGVRRAGDACTIEGTVHSDVLVGTKARDVICSRGGSDVIRGGAGNDVIYARDAERTSIDGGGGRDVAHVDRKDNVKNVEVKLYR